MRTVPLTIGAIAIIAAFAIGRSSISLPPAIAQPEAAVQVFSHFECYTAQVKQPVSVGVDLTDQFHEFQTKTATADMFCTPVTKKLINSKPLRVPPPADHLTCYHIKGPAIQQTRQIQNQLERTTVSVGTPTYLCVPTNKTG